MPPRQRGSAALIELRPAVGAIVQARMGSTRLPGKVLLEAAGKPLLAHLLARLARARTLDRIVVATSTAGRDDAIETLCERLGVPVFRGSEADVLDRYVCAAQEFDLDVVVRVTSDCPLIDPELVDEVVRFFLERRGQFDLVTNRHPLTFPDGLDFDVLTREALEHAGRTATAQHHREHTVPFFWERGLRVHNVVDPENRFRRHRWTLDYPEDYELIRRILEALHVEGEHFGTPQILAFLDANPELPSLNAKYIPAD
jgi:spore coat polysaccharide biosynthesis protein SpsF